MQPDIKNQGFSRPQINRKVRTWHMQSFSCRMWISTLLCKTVLGRFLICERVTCEIICDPVLCARRALWCVYWGRRLLEKFSVAKIAKSGFCLWKSSVLLWRQLVQNLLKTTWKESIVQQFQVLSPTVKTVFWVWS